MNRENVPPTPGKAEFVAKPKFIRWITYGFFALVIIVFIVGVVVNIRRRRDAARAAHAPVKSALTRSLTAPNLKVKSIAFGRDGQLLVAGCADGTVKVWNAENGSLLRTLAGHLRDVRAVALSPDGKFILSGSADKTVKLWDAETGELKQTLNEHQGEVFAVAISPDGQTWATAGEDQIIILWDAQTAKPRRKLTGHEDWVYALAFSPDKESHTLVSASSDYSVRVWDTSRGVQRKLLNRDNTLETVRALAFAPDGRSFASGGDMLRLWDAETGALKTALPGHTDWLRGLAFSPDGALLASCSNDWTVKLWDARSGQLKQTLNEHGDKVTAVAFSPDGKRLASGSDDGTLKVWNADVWR